MSKDIAVANNSSQEIAVSSIQLRKKEVVSKEQVSSWLEDMTSGKYALSSVIPMNAPYNYQGSVVYRSAAKIPFEELAEPTLVGGALGGFLVGFGSVPVTFVSNLSDSMFAVVTSSLLVSGFGIFGFGWHILLHAHQRRYRVLWSQLTAVQSQGVRAWLDTRYGIQVDDDVAKTLAEQVLIGAPMYEFQDTNGQFWVLQFDESMKGFLVEPKPVKVKEVEAPAGIRQAPVILSVGAGHLDGDAGMLGKHIDLRLAQLSRFALTLEESHGVARAVEDAREAVAGFERLELLGAGKNGLDRLTGILSLLNGELDAILQAKIAEEDEALLARQRSVEARQKSKKVVGV
jgi:hypothetical protein